MKIVAHPKYPDMFYIQWPDGVLSQDFYNISRANWYRRNLQWSIDYRRLDKGPWEARTAI